MAKNGGKRKGAGRKPGSSNRPKITDDLTKAEIKKLLTKAVKLAHLGDNKIIIFLLEQAYGKASQSIDLTSDGEQILTGYENLSDKELDSLAERLQAKARARKSTTGKGK